MQVPITAIWIRESRSVRRANSDTDQGDDEKREPERARSEGQQRAHDEAAAPPLLQRAEREQAEREPERERERGGNDDPRRARLRTCGSPGVTSIPTAGG